MPTRGLVLTCDVPSLSLLRFDRLEPTRRLPDVCTFPDIERFPFPCTFWRSSLDNSTRHRNPLFDRELGVSADRSLTIDVLHAQDLGNLNRFARYATWHLLLTGCWGPLGTKEQEVTTAIVVLSRELQQWYQNRHAELPDEKLTRIKSIGPTIVGNASSQALNTKGAETWATCSL